MEEEWWNYVLKEVCVWVTHTSNMSLHKYTRMARDQGGMEVKKHDRFGVRKERYAMLYAGCEGSERNGTRPLRSPC